MRREGYFLHTAFVALVAIFMVTPALPSGATGPEANDRASPREVIDDSFDLIVPLGEIYELCGCHTYSQSVQINGTLNVTPYDGVNDTNGTLTLMSNWIIMGPSGSIIADGRGYGGGGGCGGIPPYGGGRGGKGGKGGDGGAANSGGGGGGSNGGWAGAGGAHGTSGTAGTDVHGGMGGNELDYPYSWGGRGGSGFGGGGGGGGGKSGGGGGGGGGSGGEGGQDGPAGGNGSGPAQGLGGRVIPEAGHDGGYCATELNGDTSTDMSILKGSGGGGGSVGQAHGGGGGGAGGGSVALLSTGDILIGGTISTVGGGGGFSNQSYYAAPGGGGAGGGILISALNVTLTGSIDARGRDGDLFSTVNGGTVKVFSETNRTNSANISTGRIYFSCKPMMERGTYSVGAPVEEV